MRMRFIDFEKLRVNILTDLNKAHINGIDAFWYRLAAFSTIDEMLHMCRLHLRNEDVDVIDAYELLDKVNSLSKMLELDSRVTSWIVETIQKQPTIYLFDDGKMTKGGG